MAPVASAPRLTTLVMETRPTFWLKEVLGRTPKQAAKDAKKLKAAGLDKKAKKLIEVIKADPFATPPAYEPLVGNLAGLYSRRINLQHRLVYEVHPYSKPGFGETDGVVKVIRMWTHYEGL